MGLFLKLCCLAAKFLFLKKINVNCLKDVLGPKLFFVTGLVIFVAAVARLVCPDLLG